MKTDICTYVHDILPTLPRMRKVLDESCRENQNMRFIKYTCFHSNTTIFYCLQQVLVIRPLLHKI
jgi:hypothetical protein